MFSKFSEEARKILLNSKKEMVSLKHTYVGSEHFVLSLLSSSNFIKNLLNNLGVTYDNFREKVIDMIGVGSSKSEYFVYSPLLKKIIENSIISAKDKNLKEVGLDLIFLSMIDEAEGSAVRILLNMGVNFDEIYEDISKNFSLKSIKKTSLVYEYGVCLNKLAEDGEIDPVIGREDETDRLVEILCRRCKNNPLLIGEAGVGKTAIVENLARRIYLNEVPDKLIGKKIVSISLASLVSGTKYRGEFEERVTKLIKEVENDKNVIIFFDEVHTLVGAGGAEGAIDASNILKPALARGGISIIGATTIYEYKKSIENDKALSRRFQTVMISSPTKEKTFDILTKIKPIYEKYHGVEVSDDILKLIINLSNKYMYNRKEPDRSIDILDEACSRTSIIEDDLSKKCSYYKGLLSTLNNLKNNAIALKKFDEALYLREEELKLETCINKLSMKKAKQDKKKIVTKSIIADVIKSKTNVPVMELCEKNSIFSMLVESLSSEIVGEDNAIKEVVDYTKMLYNGIKISNSPISFLFYGENGVGKSYLSNIYGKIIFGDENIIRIDGSLYTEGHTVSNIIGSPLGYKDHDSKKTVLDEVRDKPYSLILIDNIDKMHYEVLNVIMEILKEGKIKDSAQNTIVFSNCTIIMTLDAVIKDDSIGFSKENKSITNLKKYVDENLLKRVGKIVKFNKLNKDNICKIIKQKIDKLEKNNEITIKDKEEFEKIILNKCDYERYGAYNIDSLIEENISCFV